MRMPRTADDHTEHATPERLTEIEVKPGFLLSILRRNRTIMRDDRCNASIEHALARATRMVPYRCAAAHRTVAARVVIPGTIATVSLHSPYRRDTVPDQPQWRNLIISKQRVGCIGVGLMGHGAAKASI
jgi:hypothetical protein